MEKVPLSNPGHGFFAQHLVAIRDERDTLLQDQLATVEKQRLETQEILDTYIEHIESLVAASSGSDQSRPTEPFIFVGCKVTLEDAETNDSLTCSIESPLGERLPSDAITYLSPLGRQLLLKSLGDEVTVEAPGGVFRYRVVSIESPVDWKDGTPSPDAQSAP